MTQKNTTIAASVAAGLTLAMAVEGKLNPTKGSAGAMDCDQMETEGNMACAGGVRKIVSRGPQNAGLPAVPTAPVTESRPVAAALPMYSTDYNEDMTVPEAQKELLKTYIHIFKTLPKPTEMNMTPQQFKNTVVELLVEQAPRRVKAGCNEMLNEATEEFLKGVVEGRTCHLRSTDDRNAVLYTADGRLPDIEEKVEFLMEKIQFKSAVSDEDANAVASLLALDQVSMSSMPSFLGSTEQASMPMEHGQQSTGSQSNGSLNNVASNNDPGTGKVRKLKLN